jgi:hypothetical protein
MSRVAVHSAASSRRVVEVLSCTGYWQYGELYRRLHFCYFSEKDEDEQLLAAMEQSRRTYEEELRRRRQLRDSVPPYGWRWWRSNLFVLFLFVFFLASIKCKKTCSYLFLWCTSFRNFWLLLYQNHLKWKYKNCVIFNRRRSFFFFFLLKFRRFTNLRDLQAFEDHS